jgi:hypothetical protein
MRMSILLAALAALGSATTHGASPVYAWDGAPRVIAFADVHGAYPELVALLRSTGVIDAELRWTAGSTHLVSLGDLLDRGGQSREVLDLLMRLQEEARSAGGRLHVVLGNHELLNLTGELGYVSAAEFASYQDLESEQVRIHAYESLRAAGRYAGQPPEKSRSEFDAAFPRGYFGHRAAFSPEGRYGRWLLERPALLRIGPAIFVHGGLPASLATLTLDGANEMLRADLIAYVRTRQQVERAGLIDFDTAFDDRVSLARQRLEKRPDSPEKASLAQAIDELERTGASPLHDVRGPLWYRGTALCSPLYETDIARAALRALRAKEVVMGHSVTPSRQVITRMDGLATLLDTGMLTRVYHGRPAALVLERSSREVLYGGQPQPIRARPQPERRRVGARPAGMDDDALESFLAAAEIVGAEPLSRDGAAPLLLSLQQGGTTLRAVFRAGRGKGWKRELAAYRLDRLIGLDMIPATVERQHDGRRGALQFRIEDSESLEELEKRQARASGWCPLDAQYNLAGVFDALIDNTARTAASIRFSPDEWLVRLTQHGEAFSQSRRLDSRARTLQVPEELARRLAALSQRELVAELGKWLDRREIDALLARRDQLVTPRVKPAA